MARRTTAQNKAIGDEILKLKAKGYGQKQATAIAMRMYKDGEIKPKRTVKKRTTAKKPTRRTRRTRRTRGR